MAPLILKGFIRFTVETTDSFLFEMKKYINRLLGHIPHRKFSSSVMVDLFKKRVRSEIGTILLKEALFLSVLLTGSHQIPCYWLFLSHGINMPFQDMRIDSGSKLKLYCKSTYH